MKLTTPAFRKTLGRELAALLGERYTFLGSRDELRADAPGGRDVVALHVASQFSPALTVSFYVGRNFDAARRVETLLGLPKAYYHIHKHSTNAERLTGLDYPGPHSWHVDLAAPAAGLAREMAAAIRAIGGAFFARFATLGTAREALARDDPWCQGGAVAWRQLLLVDLALGDPAHFEAWASGLDPATRAEAQELITRYQRLS